MIALNNLLHRPCFRTRVSYLPQMSLPFLFTLLMASSNEGAVSCENVLNLVIRPFVTLQERPDSLRTSQLETQPQFHSKLRQLCTNEAQHLQCSAESM